MVLLLYAALTVGITWLAIKGYAYRGVYIFLVPIGIGWLVVFGMAANWPGVTLENPAARSLGMDIAIAGAAVAAGGFFGAILYRKAEIEKEGEPIILTSGADDLKRCPDCAELVRSEARKCRFCGFEFSKEDLSEKTKPPNESVPSPIPLESSHLLSSETSLFGNTQSQSGEPRNRSPRRDGIVAAAIVLAALLGAYEWWGTLNKSKTNSGLDTPSPQTNAEQEERWVREHTMTGYVRNSLIVFTERGNSTKKRRTRMHLIENSENRSGFALGVDPKGPCGDKLASGLRLTYRTDKGIVTLEGGESCDINVNIDSMYVGEIAAPTFQKMVLTSMGAWTDN